MSDDLTLKMETLSDDIFSQLMDEVPAKTVTPDTLLGSKKTEPKPEPKSGEDKGKGKGKGTDVPKEEEEDDKPLGQEDVDKHLLILNGEEEDGDDDPKKAEKDTKLKAEKEDSDLDSETSSNILQLQAQLLIEKGLWREFEGMEEFEWTNENYAELVAQQAEWEIEDRFSELLDATGPYGKAIISHIQNGGNPEEVIDLFKEAKKIESFDTSTEEGKTALLTKYYKDLGWNDKRIKRTIDAAIDSNTLDEDVQEAKAEMEEAIQAEVAAKQKQQETYLAQQRAAEEAFATNITGVLRERKDLTPTEKRDIATSLLVYDKKLQDGRTVNQFTLDFAKLQSDPKKYIDLVMFVRDYDKFKENLSKQEEKKAAKKTWEFVKGNGATAKTGGGAHTKTKGKETNDLVIDYRAYN